MSNNFTSGMPGPAAVETLNLLWDRAIDRSAQAESRQANVPQQPYVYQTKVK